MKMLFSAGKPVYIFGCIIFTVAIVAISVVYVITPGAIPGGDGGRFNGTPPQDFDESMIPDNGQMEKFMGTPPQDADGKPMEPGMEFKGEMMEPPQGRGGFMGVVRIAFWPVLILCILGDMFCLYMLNKIKCRNRYALSVVHSESEMDVEDSLQ